MLERVEANAWQSGQLMQDVGNCEEHFATTLVERVRELCKASWCNEITPPKRIYKP